MKTKNIFKIIFLLILTLGLSSCDKWLDVKPKTQIESDVNFADEQGFIDALTGIYVRMTQESLYGRELSFGFVDVLGQEYTLYPSSSHTYYEDSRYNYAYATTKSRIDGIWSGMYNVIANINNLIDNLERTDISLFTGKNYDIIKGEVYGLRAFLHFDLLRLFAPAPASSAGSDALAIPYAKEFGINIVPRSSVSQVIAYILDDLNTAATLLEADPIIPESTTDPTNYMRDRAFKLNYYAIKAIEARVHLYNNDKTNALTCAEEVMNTTAFTWTPSEEIARTDLTTVNRVFSQELIFALNINTLGTLSDDWFASTAGLTKTNANFNTVFEGDISSDYRSVYLTENIAGQIYPAKLKQPTGIPYHAGNRLPLIRLSEMYYIAAECVKDSDVEEAVGYLNTVRSHRNISTTISTTLSPEEIQNEIFKEYVKEFICEGQLFYYYKRLNLSQIQFSNVVATNAIYVLPLPDDEIEFGTN